MSSLFLPRLADIYGMKRVLFVVLLNQAVFWFLLLFVSKSIWFTILIFAGFGVSAGGIFPICTIYLADFVAIKHQTMVTTVLMVLDSCAMIF